MREGASKDWDEWDGRLFHVSAVLNRESIDTHGLDWTLMGAAPGVDGSRSAQVDGCFLAPEAKVDFFVGFRRHELVDVWLIEGIPWTQLVESPEGFWYYPEKVPRSKITLYRRDLQASRRA